MPAEGPADLVQVPLPVSPHAPGQARRATQEVLIRWRMAALLDRVVLAVSELVTNAVRHGRPPVWMELRHEPARVRLAVHDGDPTEPAQGGQAVADAESGRGMDIVRALADDLAVEQVPEDGKIVRVDFGVEPGSEEAHRSGSG